MAMTMKNELGSNIPVYVIAAATVKSWGIGKNMKVPWETIPQDMKLFSRLTSKTKNGSLLNAVIMGRHTWNSLPDTFKPLPRRLNLIVSTTLHIEFSHMIPNVYVVKSFEEGYNIVQRKYGDLIESLYVIGGRRIYESAIFNGLADKIYITRIGKEFECDVFFPTIPRDLYEIVNISNTFVHKDIPYDFIVYERLDRLIEDTSEEDEAAIFKKYRKKELSCCKYVNERVHEEFQYLDLIAEILNSGNLQNDRTSVGVLSLFGRQMRFNLSNSFPLLTTKKVFWRGVVEELLWFISGNTNANTLTNKGIKIWEQNASRSFLDSVGLSNREVGDLGPVYGFQWRHFGAEYIDMHHNYDNEGIDQLKMCIDKIKSNPTDRRILMCAWNAKDIPKMALPPCHILCQFYVCKKKLSCLMYQRSCDMGLGVPFNIASYALLTCLIAHVCQLDAGEFVHVLGNCHVYLSHRKQLKEQLKREPLPFPILKLNQNVSDINAFQMEDIELIGYNCHPKIAMEMAV